MRSGCLPPASRGSIRRRITTSTRSWIRSSISSKPKGPKPPDACNLMSSLPQYRAAPTPRHRGFGHPFQAELAELLAWRRDVRHFRTDPVPEAVVDRLMDLACLAPSVGNSQPWRFVDVAAPERRAAIIANYQAANSDALGGYRGERAALYASLKLSGLQQAPVHIAVFSDETTGQGLGLGR